MLPRARTKFNDGKKGNGRAGSKFRAAFNIHQKASKIYFGGTHSDLKSLSFYNRPSGRNGQILEGVHNGTINIGASDINQSAKGSYERHFNVAKIEEVEFSTRQYQLDVLKSKPITPKNVGVASIFAPF